MSASNPDAPSPLPNEDQITNIFANYTANVLHLGEEMVLLERALHKTDGTLQIAYRDVLDHKFMELVRIQNKFRFWLCEWLSLLNDRHYETFRPFNPPEA
jgi:hypothetical protein